MTHKILNKKSVLKLMMSVSSLMIITNSALAAGSAPPAAAVADVHADVAKTTTGAVMSANAGASTGNTVALDTNVISYDPTAPYYIGGTLGWGDNYQYVFSGPASNSNSNGIAGRIFAGYRFTDTFSVEGGYSKYSDVTGRYITVNPVFGPIRAEGTVRTYAFDAVLKINIPLRKMFSRVNIYGKLGMAYLNECGGTLNNDALLLPSIPGSPVEPINQSNPIGNKLLPTFSLGLNYHIMKHLEADLVWMHIQMLGSSGLNNTDSVGLGLDYSF